MARQLEEEERLRTLRAAEDTQPVQASLGSLDVFRGLRGLLGLKGFRGLGFRSWGLSELPKFSDFWRTQSKLPCSDIILPLGL